MPFRRKSEVSTVDEILSKPPLISKERVEAFRSRCWRVRISCIRAVQALNVLRSGREPHRLRLSRPAVPARGESQDATILSSIFEIVRRWTMTWKEKRAEQSGLPSLERTMPLASFTDVGWNLYRRRGPRKDSKREGLVLLIVFHIPYRIWLGLGAEMFEDLESATHISCEENSETCRNGYNMLDVGVRSLLGKKWQSKVLFILVSDMASGKNEKQSGWQPVERRLAARCPGPLYWQGTPFSGPLCLFNYLEVNKRLDFHFSPLGK